MLPVEAVMIPLAAHNVYRYVCMHAGYTFCLLYSETYTAYVYANSESFGAMYNRTRLLHP